MGRPLRGLAAHNRETWDAGRTGGCGWLWPLTHVKFSRHFRPSLLVWYPDLTSLTPADA